MKKLGKSRKDNINTIEYFICVCNGCACTCRCSCTCNCGGLETMESSIFNSHNDTEYDGLTSADYESEDADAADMFYLQ